MCCGNVSFSSTNPYANVPMFPCSNLSLSISINQPILTPLGKELFYCYYVKCFTYYESFIRGLYFDVADYHFEANACSGIMVNHIRLKIKIWHGVGRKSVTIFKVKKKLLRQFSIWTALHNCHTKQFCQGNIFSFFWTSSILQSITNGLPCLGGTSRWPLHCKLLKCRHHFCKWHIILMQMPY